MTTALKITHLNKTIGRRQILHDISFETYAGEVFGFLGPNGAGKTTTIKMIVGLLATDEGRIEIDGFDINRSYEKAMRNVGGIVENPELYKYLTGMQNLWQYARMRSGVTQKRIDEVVSLVGLSNRIHDKVSKYSLGMRQRLGVAQSILHHPKLLVLDEPTNGLDPAGIKELRDILKNLAHEEGISVMVSSHLMSEMELMCDRVGIIMNGSLIGVQTVEELISTASGSDRYVFTLNNAAQAATLLPGDFRVQVLDDRRLELALGENAEEQVADLVSLFVSSGLRLYGAAPAERKKLEDVFIELTETGGNQIG
jgi:ABC-2 type transport system ATP-binding protein